MEYEIVVWAGAMGDDGAGGVVPLPQDSSKSEPIVSQIALTPDILQLLGAGVHQLSLSLTRTWGTIFGVSTP
jgi:hypothetical protein